PLRLVWSSLEILIRALAHSFFNHRLHGLFCWHSDYRFSIRYVLHHHCARANNRARTDPDLLSHHRADTDVRTWSNLNAARQTCSSSDMRMIADHAIVFDDGSSINDYIVANHSIRIHDRARHYRWSNSDLR